MNNNICETCLCCDGECNCRNEDEMVKIMLLETSSKISKSTNDPKITIEDIEFVFSLGVGTVKEYKLRK